MRLHYLICDTEKNIINSTLKMILKSMERSLKYNTIRTSPVLPLLKVIRERESVLFHKQMKMESSSFSNFILDYNCVCASVIHSRIAKYRLKKDDIT